MKIAVFIVAVLILGVVSPVLSAENNGVKTDFPIPSSKEKPTPSTVIHAGKPAGEGKKVRLFILTGQSNMVGLKERFSFVPVVEKAFAQDELIIVKNAVNGQPIRKWYRDWKPIGEDAKKNDKMLREAKQHNIYKKLMEMVNKEIDGKKPDSITLIWMQGEADAKQGQADNYQASLDGLIKQFRDDLNRQDIRFVIGRISDNQIDMKGWKTVRDAQVKVAENDKLGAWIDTDDLNGKGNSLHYGRDGYQALGERFGKEAVKLQNGK